MFSTRLPWELRPNALALALQARQRGGGLILDLTESNPTRAGFCYPEAEILEALARPAALLYEPSPAGLPAARAAVSEYYRSRNCTVPPECILLTASTSEAYAWLFKLLAEPGDDILVPRPSYPLFEYLAGLEAVRPVPYPLRYHGSWTLDLEALEAAATPRSRAIVLVHPNNPTGSFLKRAELAGLRRLCRERGMALIVDEVFADYAYEPDPARPDTLAAETEMLTFALSGLSKVAGLPQMKLGWLVVSGPQAMQQAARQRLELIADTYLSVGTPVQQALPQLLALGAAVRQQIRQRVGENRSFLSASLSSASAVSLLHAEGGWYATLQLPRTRSEEQWCLELLERAGVLVQPGYFYDFEDEAFLVVSLLTPPQTFRKGIGSLLALVASA